VLTPSKRIIPLSEPAIHLIRGQRVMLDSDLAAIDQVSTRAQIATSKKHGGRRGFHAREDGARYHIRKTGRT